jgi:SET domain-containing protein
MSEIYAHSNGKIVIKKSSIHGIGVFATEDISNGELIEVCTSLDLDRCNRATLTEYSYTIPSENKFNRLALLLGYGSLYNHSEDNNVDFTINSDSKRFTFFATKDISAGSELTINYQKNKNT